MITAGRAALRAWHITKPFPILFLIWPTHQIDYQCKMHLDIETLRPKNELR